MQHQTNVKGYVKDVSTGIVVNNDSQEYAAYIFQREQNRKLQNCQKDIESIKAELREIKTALHQHIKRETKCQDQ
jgi:hypothetical protein